MEKNVYLCCVPLVKVSQYVHTILQSRTGKNSGSETLRACVPRYLVLLIRILSLNTRHSVICVWSFRGNNANFKSFEDKP